MSETIVDEIRKRSAWYGTKARKNRMAFFVFKFIQIVMAAAIPVVSLSLAVNVQRWTSALLGAFVGIVEAVLQLGQYQQNWLLYRATREALRREDFLYSGKVGVYAGQTDAESVYAERADAIMSGENSKWLSSQQEQIRPPK